MGCLMQLHNLHVVDITLTNNYQLSASCEVSIGETVRFFFEII